MESPRTNIIVFHGVGGIGKSTLSRKIEASLAHSEHRPVQWEASSHEERILPVRIDLAQAAGMDFERVILTIRLAVATLGRPMPAFNLALRRYWEHNHPGEPIEDYLRRGGLLSRFSAAAALPQQMQSALSDVAQALLLPGTVGSALGHGGGALIKALRERRQSVRALAGCSRLADLLEAEPDLERARLEREAKQQRLREERERQEAERRRLEAEREERERREWESAVSAASTKAVHAVRAEHFGTALEQWKVTGEIRAFCGALDEAAATSDNGVEAERLREWSAWGKAEADRLDPTMNGKGLAALDFHAEPTGDQLRPFLDGWNPHRPEREQPAARPESPKPTPESWRGSIDARQDQGWRYGRQGRAQWWRR